MNLVSRRSFLNHSAAALLSVLLFNPFKQLLALQKKGSPLPSWKELVEYARWCPSVHNLQPHKIKVVSETEAELYYDPLRLLPVGDPQSVFATVAMGIFVEHLSIVASAYKMKVEFAEVFDPINTGGTALRKFAVLRLISSNDDEEYNKNHILKRRTARLHYDGKPLKQETLDNLKKQGEKFDHDFYWSHDKDLIDFIIQLNEDTLFEDISSKADREELDHLFRYTKEDAETKKDGLWAKCMGFKGSLVKSVFRHHERWEKGLKHKLLAGYYKRSFHGTATICWFGGKFNNTNDRVIAGKMMARCWLSLTKDNAYLQPFGSLITNASAHKKINERLMQPQGDKKIWLLFRAGYCSEPARSYRLSTNDIIIS